MVGAYLDADGIEVDDRVELLQGTVLPLHDRLAHRVGDLTDRPGRQLHTQGGLQVVADLAHRHTARVQAHNHRVQAIHAPLALTYQAGRKRAGPVPGDLDLEGAHLRIDHLGRGAITGVTTGSLGRLALLVAQVIGQLCLQAPLQGLLQQRRQQPVSTSELHLAGLDLLKQVIQRTRGG